LNHVEKLHKLEVFKLHKEGKLTREIAKLIGCKTETISNLLERHGRDPLENKASRVKIKVIKPKKELRRPVNRRFVDEYLKNHPCVDCGNSDVRVLEFDHVTGIKEGNVSYMVLHCSTIKLLKEIDKCEIRCCNCHRLVTIARRKNKTKPK